MPTPLPPISDFNHADTTEGGYKVAFAAARAFLAGLIGATGATKDARQALGVAGNEVVYKSDDYTLTASDCGKTFVWAGSDPHTASFASAADLGNGWTAEFINKMSEDLTLDPATVEAIDDSATLVLPPNGRAIVRCDGTGLLIAVKVDNSLVASFNTRIGAVTLTSGDVTGALGFTPATSSHNHNSSYVRLDHSGMAVGSYAFVARSDGNGGLTKNAAIAGGQIGISDGGTWRIGYGVISIGATKYAVAQRVS